MKSETFAGFAFRQNAAPLMESQTEVYRGAKIF